MSRFCQLMGGSVSVDSDRNPGDFYLVERETLKATYILSRRAWIDPKTQSPVEAITYKTRDGATIHGFLTARDGLATRKGPLVIMPHGGPHGPRGDLGRASHPAGRVGYGGRSRVRARCRTSGPVAR